MNMARDREVWGTKERIVRNDLLNDPRNRLSKILSDMDSII